jgi:hypothetical protein
MSKKRRKLLESGGTMPSPPVAVLAAERDHRHRLIEIDALAAGAILLCLVLGYATRNNLNPDGVSYLDLAAALARGDWGAFVQGYWSPLYPGLLALIGAVSSMERTEFLPAVHMLNAVIACAGVLAVWRWAHVRRDRLLARAGMIAFVLAAARPLRIEAVTPDMLLLVIMAWLGYELLEHDGRRWIRVGVLLGVAYLTKTSVWPWLVVATGVRLAFTWRGEARRHVVGAAAVAALVMAPWVGAMSVEERGFTLSSAGRLNLCWYLRQCDGRTPDTHRGDHVMHGGTTLRSGDAITVAQFPAEPAWTYFPWSDPTAWASGLRSQSSHETTPKEYVVYWARQTWYVVTVWMMPVLVLVLLPLLATHWPVRARRSWRGVGPRYLSVAVLGLIGIAQFIAVHAEPRLIAPFNLLLAMSVIGWLREPGNETGVTSLMRWWREGVTIAMVLIGGTLAARRVSGELSASALVDQRYLAIDAQLRTEHPDGARRLAVIGYAVPALSDAWRAGARIVTQIPPHSAVALGKLAPEDQVAEVRRLVGTTADVAWLINPDGRFQWVTISPR